MNLVIPDAMQWRSGTRRLEPGEGFFPMLSPEFQPCVYLLASRRKGTLYVGVTSNLLKRVHEHKTGAVNGFTRHYHVHRLVWFEQHATMQAAIAREKSIRGWKRQWKLELIQAQNPCWHDLHDALID